jgi:hypothetical protein
MREAHFNLARLLMKTASSTRPRRSSPRGGLVADDPQTLVDLGVLAALQSRTDDAIRHFTEALRLQPDLPDARHNLDALTRGARRPVGRGALAGFRTVFSCQRASVTTSDRLSPSFRTTDGSKPECILQLWQRGSWRDSQYAQSTSPKNSFHVP